MPKVVWALICEQAAFTPDGKIVIQSEFAHGLFEKFPATASPFFVVARISGNPDEVFNLKVRIKPPSGSYVIIENLGNITVNKNGFALLVNQFVTVVFPIPGKYSIEYLINNSRAHTMYLALIQG